ncbi:MAG: prepilin-type N-terminal cleavage/methylation domain-containing protein [Candidatus Pacebacteria bacterium]|nr:prepilin-type N-terminal cleavage/methylation domain-containing protein [Candidatus Paceibacterota bacterium]
MNKFKKAYTLIEMLMVVAIIGVLASSILIGLGSTRSKARDTRRLTDLKSTQTALELYYSKYGVYPSRTPGTNET